jgi:hypothetical protein
LFDAAPTELSSAAAIIAINISLLWSSSLTVSIIAVYIYAIMEFGWFAIIAINMPLLRSYPSAAAIIAINISLLRSSLSQPVLQLR